MVIVILSLNRAIWIMHGFVKIIQCVRFVKERILKLEVDTKAIGGLVKINQYAKNVVKEDLKHIMDIDFIKGIVIIVNQIY